MTPEEFFADSPLGAAVFDRVRAVLQPCGPFEVRTTKRQVAFRARRGFAYLWLPGMYLRSPAAEVVLSLAVDHDLDSPRFKEVVQVSGITWQHHLELHDLADVDTEVEGWLREAYGSAA